MSKFISIDPGNVQSAFCLMDAETMEPKQFGKVLNERLTEILKEKLADCDFVVIEQVASYGMPVGRSVFETCEWIGRIKQIVEHQGKETYEVYRKDVVLNLCQSARGNDSNVRRALIDRFAEFDFVNGKGKKNNPDWFYGFYADCWSAYAIGVTYLDLKRIEALKQNV
jgi:hypothetical protein